MRQKDEEAGRTGPVGRVGTLCLLVSLVGAGTGWGQDAQVSSVLLTFDFQTPGARSLGMGGAFLGLADDATAAYSNPAGLTSLKVGGPEVALEVRARSVVEHNTAGGRLVSIPTGIGLDTVDGPVRQEFQGDTTDLSFLSVGYVLPGGVTLALYRHELVSYQMTAESQGLFYGANPFVSVCPPLPPGSTQCPFGRTAASQVRQEVSVANFGLSAAFEVDVPFTSWEDTLSVGLGVSLYELDLLSQVDYYGGSGPYQGCAVFEGRLICDPEAVRRPDGFFGPNLFLADRYQGSGSELGDDGDTGFSLGLLWKIGEAERWRLGAVYRQGPRFATERTDRFGAIELGPRQRGSLTIPDTYGAGIAYSTSGGRTKLAFDYNRIRYSQRRAELVEPLQRTLEAQLGGEIPRSAMRFELNDADQLHFGFEQVVPIVEPALIGTLRLGVWREPFHDPAYVGDDEFLRELLPAFLPERRGAETHISAGLGIVLKENVQIDAAADFSDRNDIVSLSLVKFF